VKRQRPGGGALAAYADSMQTYARRLGGGAEQGADGDPGATDGDAA